MMRRTVLFATALLVAAAADADEHETSEPSYAKPGPYVGAGLVGAHYWDDIGNPGGVGGQLRLGERFDQGSGVWGAGLELWARAVFLHTNEGSRDLVPFSINFGPVLYYGRDRLQPFVRLGFGVHGARIDRFANDEVETSAGVSGGIGAEYHLSERIAAYATIDLEAPITNDSQLTHQESWGGTLGLRIRLE